ncbi:MAG: hypothetical protein Q8868_03645 [Bacteroidota bacterium]|nr:hypothetical protein [Bacteroidota bacterium]
MEQEEACSSIHVSAYKMSLAKQLEENSRKLMEHYRKLQDQQKETEGQKQEILSFVCDWQ